MSGTGRIIAVSISQNKGEQKTNVPFAEVKENFGIVGDAHAGNWHRQLSLLANESINKIRLAGLPDLQSGAFAENITTECIDIPNLPVGTKLLLGKNVIIQITQIGKECHSRCAIYAQVGDCVMPREGIFAAVLKGGSIAPGDNITFINN